MSIKSQLAELYKNRELPMDEYKKLPAFSIMEMESTIIGKIESFHLPEITKLICGSEILGAVSWAVKYRRIRPLYCEPEAIDVVRVITECGTVSVFEHDILRFADSDILHVFKNYCDNLLSLQAAKRRERQNLMKKISAAKKKLEAAVITPDESMREEEHKITLGEEAQRVLKEEISGNESKRDALKRDLASLDKDIRRYKEYIEKICEYGRKIEEAGSDENREKAYRALDDEAPSQEEIFLRNFLAKGVVTEEYHARFHDQSFAERVFQCLEEDSFKAYLIPVLLRLYDEGAIDLTEGTASDFIERHPEKICGYLIEKASRDVKIWDDSEYELLVEKAIQKELSNVTEEETPFFAKFWNTITDRETWKWIVRKVKEITDDENINTAIGCLLAQLEGKAARTLVETIFDDSDPDIKISASEAISSLLKHDGAAGRDAVIETVRLLEQNNRKIHRKLKTEERKLRSHSQELFSSVYLPVEQLEELAISLKLTTGDIKASLVGAHLVDLVLSLREGLEALDLQPAADMDDWKYQNKIEFDPGAHRVIADNGRMPDGVRLRSLGFRYQDDDGEWQQYPAQVSTETEVQESKKKPRRGYPKNKQPGKPKKAGSARHLTGKNTKKNVKVKKGNRLENRKKK